MNNNAQNGSDFEHHMEENLIKRNIKYQFTLKTSGERPDQLVRSITGQYYIFSDKLTLRERWRQDITINGQARLDFKNIKTIIWTGDNKKTIKNVKNKIKESPFLKDHIKDIVHIDDFDKYVDKLKLGNLPPQCMKRIKRFNKKRSNI